MITLAPVPENPDKKTPVGETGVLDLTADIRSMHFYILLLFNFFYVKSFVPRISF